MGNQTHAAQPPDLPLLEAWAANLEKRTHREGGHGADVPKGFVGLLAHLAMEKGEHAMMAEGASIAFGTVAGTFAAASIAGAVAIYEGFEAGMWLREKLGIEWFDDSKAEARRDDFRGFMQQNFWTDQEQMAKQARAEAFAQMIGGGGNYGVPPLSTEAARERVQMTQAISDKWLQDLQKEKVLVEMVRAGVANPNAPNGPHGGMAYLPDGTAFGPATGFGKVEDCGKYVTEIRTSMAHDLETLDKFDRDSAHWELTPDQKGLIHL